MINYKRVADVLDDTADAIETHGWTQHTIRDHHGYCISGAMQLVGNELTSIEIDFDIEPRDRTMYVAGAMLNMAVRALSVVSWNDEPGRTKQEVLDLLRKVAKDARSRDDEAKLQQLR